MTLVGRFALERTVFIYLFMYGCGRVHVCVHFFLFQFALGASDASAAPRRADTDDEPYRKRHRWEIRVGAIRPRGSLAEETQTGLFSATLRRSFFFGLIFPCESFPEEKAKECPWTFSASSFLSALVFALRRRSTKRSASYGCISHCCLPPLLPAFWCWGVYMGSSAHFCSRPA